VNVRGVSYVNPADVLASEAGQRAIQRTVDADLTKKASAPLRRVTGYVKRDLLWHEQLECGHVVFPPTRSGNACGAGSAQRRRCAYCAADQAP
jgi:hypothetical protein